MSDLDTQLRGIWQSSPEEPILMRTEEISAHAARLERNVKRRNLVEYVAGAAAIALFVWYLVVLQGAWQRAGSAAILIGVVFAMANLHFRAGPGGPDASADCRSYYLQALERQRGALRTFALWYLLPLVPGLIVFEIGTWLATPQDERAGRAGFWLACFGLFALAWWLNRQRVRRIQRQIDHVRALHDSSV